MRPCRIACSYVVSYQGSEASTSEGIQAVFEKARQFGSESNLEDEVRVETCIAIIAG